MKTLEGGYSRNIVLAWRFYLIFQFLWNKRFIMIRKTHRDKSTSLLRREPAIPHFEVDTFYFSDLIFTTLFYPEICAFHWSLKSRFGWKCHSLMTMMFTRYFLFRKELYEKCQTRPYICKVSEAVRKCSLLFLLFIMIWVNELE